MKKYLLTLAALPFAVVAVVFILHKTALAATQPHHVSTNDLFYNFLAWTHDSLHPTIYRIAPPPILVSSAFTYPSNPYSSVNPNKFTFTDINGDNLPDFLYYEKQNDNVGKQSQFYAIFLNNGNSNFNLAFKCANTWDSGVYGDCAGAPYTNQNDPANQNMLTQVLYLANYASGSQFNDPNLPNTHLWIDINGDGLQDVIDTTLHINSNSAAPYLLQW